jgi:hypothetical protein
VSHRAVRSEAWSLHRLDEPSNSTGTEGLAALDRATRERENSDETKSHAMRRTSLPPSAASQRPADAVGPEAGADGGGAPAPAAVPERRASRSARWGKRVGTVGFLFFLIKGLLWLLVPALIVAWQWVRSL